MLKVEIAGKALTTTNNKQTMKINGTEVEIERVGNSIYVNKVAINLIVVDKKYTKLKKALVNISVGGVVLAAAYGVYLNYETILPMLDVFQPAIEWITSLV